MTLFHQQFGGVHKETNYEHIFRCHVAQRIKKYGSVAPFSNDIQETLNCILKGIFRDKTNRHFNWIEQARKRLVYPQIFVLAGHSKIEDFSHFDKKKMTDAKNIGEEQLDDDELQRLTLEIASFHQPPTSPPVIVREPQKRKLDRKNRNCFKN
eukprot:TRINITY_DN1910_c0_g1_i3.p1 TRINITY_DN1910_c0_g1~~TRINITY_DN1910_c0_g1_i3.p1  ORF type:complete len:153 (+),score=21.94 TRINITY_DN1910_c0_g1_i3:74-532(+)